nr:DUF2169 domain-containing protein [Pyxidicoccus fallax]
MFLLQDEHGADVLTLVVKATFVLHASGVVEPLQPPPPVNPEPAFHGTPGSSSLKYESEAVFTKTATDVVLLGHAHSPGGRATEVTVSLRIGSLTKRVLVLGSRVWSRILGSATISPPLPFERIPLTYERAYGGWDRSNPDLPEADLRNPVGTGFIARPSQGRYDGLRLPNLEDPQHRIRHPSDKPPPAGFGFIASHWQPRLQLAGSYDQAWKEERFPLLPRDFDLRHLNAAPTDQQVPGFLSGGEPVEILNASVRGPLRFKLPTYRLEGVVMLHSYRRHALPMPLDTVVIDTDEARLVMVWRCSVPIHRQIHEVVWVKVQQLGGGPIP